MLNKYIAGILTYLPAYLTKYPKLALIIFLALILRAGLLYYNSHTLELNPDEYPNYHLAENWLQGQGYTRYDPLIQKTKAFAYYGTFPVWVYALLLHFKISIAYWVLLVHLTALVLYAASIFYFYRTLAFFISSENIRLGGTVIYAIYPSTLLYIGSFFWYENITMPLMVIVLYYLVQLLQNYQIPRLIAVLIPLLVTFSTLLRGQMLFIYSFIFTIFLFYLWPAFRKNSRSSRTGIFISVATLLLVISSHIPILIKNYRLFGGLLLSTQPGFELWQGHNPYATGKWKWSMPGEPLYDYTTARLPHLPQLDQYTESRERARLALDWIKQNPTEELFLLGRKLILYFTPDNSPTYDIAPTSFPGYNWLNPINFLVHALFLLSLVFAIFRNKYFGFSAPEMFFLTPVLASILLCLIFFFGYRWRYYAEPYLIFYAFVFLQKLKNYHSFKTKTKALAKLS